MQKQRPIKTEPIEERSLIERFNRFLTIFGLNGKNLRFEAVCNDDGARFVIVYDWVNSKDKLQMMQNWYKKNK